MIIVEDCAEVKLVFRRFYFHLWVLTGLRMGSTGEAEGKGKEDRLELYRGERPRGSAIYA